MAIVIRYFSTSSAGAADGTTWADRAAFISGGAVNTIVSAFDFTTDSLEARIGPGTYTLTTSIQTFTGTTTPSVFIPCFLQACDSSGNLWVPPDPDWCSAQAVWSDTDMPILAATTNIFVVHNSSVRLLGLKLTGSGNTSSGIINTVASMDWCYLVNSTSNANTYGIAAATSITNSCIAMTGTAYSGACLAGASNGIRNLRLEGNASASSGNRYGWNPNSNGTFILDRVTAFNHVGGGIKNVNTGTGTRLSLSRSTIVGCTADNVAHAGTATSATGIVSGCMITGSGAYGVNCSGTGKLEVQNCRLRNNTSGNITGLGNFPLTQNNETSSGSDTDEYVDSTNYDYRIKSTSSMWGKGYGAGDEPTSGGGGPLISGRLVA